MYGGNRTTRRARALAGACLAAGALALAGASAAHAQTPLPDTHNVPTNAVADHVTFMDNVLGVSGYSAANFINYADKGDFLFANGTGGLASGRSRTRRTPRTSRASRRLSSAWPATRRIASTRART